MIHKTIAEWIEAINRCADNIENLDETVKELVKWLKEAQIIDIWRR